ncbi:MAG: nucleoside 2-deoxyribosyltransferase [Clostridia bacterium]|nr:nucleoside 2-deoxyribosyltransferase [Clostridia bacterium]
MKKIYFAGKFNLNKDKTLPLDKRLKEDFRSKILGDSKKLTCSDDNLLLNNKYKYAGPFYCEQASNGDYTSTDCNVVLNEEYKAVSNSDIYLAVFDENFSVGTIVELGWAITQNKKIFIFYKEEDSKYQIKSEYWFAIADALKRGKDVTVYGFDDIDEALRIIKEEVLEYEV